MSITTERPVTTFRDWHQISRTDHNLSNAEVLRKFGNDVNKPDTNNATFFRPDDVGKADIVFIGTQVSRSHKQHYRALSLYNAGSWNGSKRDNSVYLTRRQKLHTLQAISGQLDLSPGQFRRARSLLMTLDLGKLGERIEYSILALCAFVVHSDERCSRRVHPNTPADCMDTELAALLSGMESSIQLTPAVFRAVYGRIESDLRTGNSFSQLRVQTERRTDGQPIKYDRFDMDSRRVMDNPTQDQRDAAVQAKW